MTTDLYSTPSIGRGLIMGSPGRRELADSGRAYRIVFLQLATALLVALPLAPVGWVYAWSGVLGGLIAVTGNALFARQLFGRYRAQEPGQLLGRFYLAELAKLLLTALLFALVVVLVKPISIVTLLGCFLLVQLVPALTVNRLG